MAAAFGAVFALSGCDLPPATSPVPKARPDQPGPDTPSAKSADYRKYYARVETRLKAQGLLRTDGGGPDTPFSKRQLVENFVRIALYDEYTVRGGRFVAQQTPSTLRRWQSPVRLKLVFGASVSPQQRAADKAEVTRYIARLARISGADIRVTEGPANYHVLVMNTDELAAVGPRLRELVPGIDDTTLSEITNLPRFTFCSVYAFSKQGQDNVYAAAVSVIRDEHPPLLRKSCFHEELAQGLGLANDSPNARPSIFNDDEEFALLTRHDELLLKLLYDPRMTPGMDPETARRVAEVIASELLGGES
ncbi:MAG: DUF2927 domain-containing protein [Brevirhabdus sp.]